MNVGDGAQMGDVDATAAGRDIHQVHNDLQEMGRILQYFTDALERQRKDDELERRTRQRETDMYTAGVRSAIDALRDEQAAIRTSVAVVRATVDTLDQRTLFVPWLSVAVTALSALTILIIGAVGAILYIILTRPDLVAAFR